MTRRGVPLAVALAAVATGCGGGDTRDLFAVDRSGTVPRAELRLVVDDQGLVTCNGGSPRRIPSERLLEAREIQRGLRPLAERRTILPPGPRSVLRYTVRSARGRVSFSDTSPRLPAVLQDVQAFTRFAAEDVCGLPR